MSSKLQMSKIVIKCSYLKNIRIEKWSIINTNIHKIIGGNFLPPMIYLRQQLPFAAENCEGCNFG